MTLIDFQKKTCISHIFLRFSQVFYDLSKSSNKESKDSCIDFHRCSYSFPSFHHFPNRLSFSRMFIPSVYPTAYHFPSVLPSISFNFPMNFPLIVFLRFPMFQVSFPQRIAPAPRHTPPPGAAALPVPRPAPTAVPRSAAAPEGRGEGREGPGSSATPRVWFLKIGVPPNHPFLQFSIRNHMSVL